jgi:TPR repeat protein
MPRIADYGTSIDAISKYMDAIDKTQINTCRDAVKNKVSDGEYCLYLRQTGSLKISHLKEAAAMMHPFAQSDLAHYYSSLKQPDLSPEIKRLIQLAADSGIPHAQVSVGWWSMTGEYGFLVDYGNAMEWNMKGYEQGHSEGANNIGELYEMGHGVTQDIEMAKSWYKKASALGNADATQSLVRLTK